MLRFITPVFATLAATSALAAANSDQFVPAEHHDGKVTYVSGGIGEAESTAMKREAHHYPLELLFVARRGAHDDYLADIPVTIKDAKGHVVFRGKSDGPYFLARLPAGRYSVMSRDNGHAISRQVEIGNKGTQRLVFEWKGKGGRTTA